MNRRATDIANEVRAGVADGWLTDGERLGAEPDLIKSFRASRATVAAERVDPVNRAA
jgi:DNA-binding GntR family transcriptional regulator